MKPLHIGLLVLVGAMGGALIMRLMQHPRPAPEPVPVATTAPAPAVAVPAPAPVSEAKPSAVPEPEKPAPAAPKPPRPARKAPVAVAQNLPPAQPPQSAPAQAIPSQDRVQPVPEPIQAATPPSAPPITQPEPAPAPAAAEPTEPAEPAAPQPPPSVTLPAGLVFTVRLGQSLSSEHNQAGDTFLGTLDAPVSAGGYVIAERGAHVEGRVVQAQKKSALVLELTKLDTSDGQHVAIQTESLRKQAAKATGDDVSVVAAAAGIGAIIGAIAGGGKGAAIGAGAGGAAGAGGVAATRGKAVSLPTETKVSFRLKEPVTITERLNR